MDKEEMIKFVEERFKKDWQNLFNYLDNIVRLMYEFEDKFYSWKLCIDSWWLDCDCIIALVDVEHDWKNFSILVDWWCRDYFTDVEDFVDYMIDLNDRWDYVKSFF